MPTPAALRSSHNTGTQYHLPNECVPIILSSHTFTPPNQLTTHCSSATEHTRLESQAAAFASLMHDRVIHAPLHNPQRILDVGCGTGAVTYHLGATYPKASSVYGVDLSPVPQIPRPEPQAQNISYIQGDVRELAETDERLGAGSFDYIFSRLLICGMTDWPGYMQDTVVPLLKPGGWVEVQDLDYIWYKHGRVCSDDWPWVKAVTQGAQSKNMDLRCGSNAATYMHQAGLVDIAVSCYGAPFGEWAVRERPETEWVGKLQATDLAPLYEFIVPSMTEGLGFSEDEVGEFVRESRECLGAEDGLEWVVYVTVGRKPGG